MLWISSAWGAPLSIDFTRYELENGLEVILSQDQSVPVVQVNIWYHVGAKDELPQRSGFAHLFEHLMFQGSKHHDTDYFEPLLEVGARINGTTNPDRTNYFEGVPPEYLPLALWLESDRMGYLLPALTQEKLDNQRDVVRNERRQRYENRPYGEAWVTLNEHLYPGHPYQIPTIGLHEDLEAATLEDVHDFFNTWYVPNNATLVICGNFELDTAKALVEQYFGDIPRGEDPVRAEVPFPVLEEEVVVREEEEGVKEQKVWMAWNTPSIYAPGDAELDIVAHLLATGKNSPLYRELVVEEQIATSIGAYQSSSELASTFVISATAAEGHTTDEIVSSVDKILAEFKEHPPDQRALEIAATKYEASFIRGLQTVSNRANTLNSYNHYVGDPGYIQESLDRYTEATPETVLATAQEWLGAERVVLHIWPGDEEEEVEPAVDEEETP